MNDTIKSREELITMIEQTSGRFFSCEFIKKTDNTLRQMTARTGVTMWVTSDGSIKMVLGTGTANDPEKSGIFKVLDVHPRIRDYRSISIDNIVRFKCGDVQYDCRQTKLRELAKTLRSRIDSVVTFK